MKAMLIAWVCVLVMIVTIKFLIYTMNGKESLRYLRDQKIPKRITVCWFVLIVDFIWAVILTIITIINW